MDDHEWMYTGCSSQGSFTDEWIEKTDAFTDDETYDPSNPDHDDYF